MLSVFTSVPAGAVAAVGRALGFVSGNAIADAQKRKRAREVGAADASAGGAPGGGRGGGGAAASHPKG